MITQKIGQAAAQFIGSQKELSKDDSEIISYGVEVIWATFAKLMIVFAVAWLTGTLIPTAITLVSFGVLRQFAGGIHAKSFLSCLIAMFFIIGISVFVPRVLTINLLSEIVIFTCCFIAIIAYAPADVTEKPIVGTRHKKALRLLSSLTVIVLFAVSAVIGGKYGEIILWSCLFETLTILPIIYRLTKTERGDSYEKKES